MMYHKDHLNSLIIVNALRVLAVIPVVYLYMKYILQASRNRIV